MTAEKGKRAAYTLASYKLEGVRLVQGDQACTATAKILGIPHQTLDLWVRLAVAGKLTGVGALAC
jgi:transposase-like protein